MLVDWIRSLRRMLLLALLTLALVATGFAHRMPTQEKAALALALASGFAASDLCNDAEQRDDHVDQHCPACQIAGSAELPPDPGDLQDMGLVILARSGAPRESRLISPVHDPAHSPQGPPAA